MTQQIPLPTRPGPATRITVARPRVGTQLGRFLATEAGSALLLLGAAIVAVVWANTPWSSSYDRVWTTVGTIRVGSADLSLDMRHWINDAAMALFFMVVGLEISREFAVGELRNVRSIVVPAFGAVGGMAAPALLYWAFNHSGPAASGWGIPMSTDTAFLIGILALFGPRCPDRLRLFLLTLAIVDDIGAIGVMAVFYTDHVDVTALIVSAVLIAVLVLFRWLRVWQLEPYLLVGIGLWLSVHASGVHPTLAGVLVGLLIPASPVEAGQSDRLFFYGRALVERGEARRARLAVSAARAIVPANERLQDYLHPVSAFLVVPLFGLANAGVSLDGHSLRMAATSSVTIGVAVALIVGNSIGITLGASLALGAGLGALPGRVRYGHLVGGAVLAGIGFTISLFIADLAFPDAALRDQAKVGILAGSLIAAVLGSVLLRYLGDKLPMCSPDEEGGPPALPPLPWGVGTA